MDIYKLQKTLIERTSMIAKLGGEWNDGYLQGLNDALELVDDYIAKLEQIDKITHNFYVNTNPYKAPDKKGKCGGKDCPCNKK